MPFPYELYPKAKETHCLNLPEISVSRPPFPGSIRTADGCLWGWRDNNSYVSTHKTDKVCTADGKCYNYNDVFVDEVDPGYSNTCGQTCYVACSCNTSNGWYSSCQGSDCFSVTDTRYAGQPNAASASRSISDVASISASGVNSGISASAAANSGLKPPPRPVTTLPQQFPPASRLLLPPSQQQAPPPASRPWPPALPPATRKRPVPKAVTTIPSRLTKSALQRVTTDTPAIPVAAIRLAPTMATILPFLPGKPVPPFTPASGLTCYKDCKDDYFTLNAIK